MALISWIIRNRHEFILEQIWPSTALVPVFAFQDRHSESLVCNILLIWLGPLELGRGLLMIPLTPLMRFTIVTQKTSLGKPCLLRLSTGSTESSIFYDRYVPLMPGKISKFRCGLYNQFTLETFLLHYRKRGMFIDSSWRNKSENRAAMTVIVVVNEAMHLMPGI